MEKKEGKGRDKERDKGKDRKGWKDRRGTGKDERNM